MKSMESKHHELATAATEETVRELDQLNHGRWIICNIYTHWWCPAV